MVYLYVFLGGGFGCVLRFVIANLLMRATSLNFPFSTLIVNVLGSFGIGILFTLFNTKPQFTSTIYPIFIVGFLGGFTTFSALSLETLLLFKNQETGLAFINIGANFLLCLAAAAFGIFIAKHF
jgi:fluoride exporter